MFFGDFSKRNQVKIYGYKCAKFKINKKKSQNLPNFKLEIGFFPIKNVKSQNSKIAHIYLPWATSVASLK